MKKERFIYLIIIILFILTITVILLNTNIYNKENNNIVDNNDNNSKINESEIMNIKNDDDKSILTSTDDLQLQDIDGKKMNYSFTYKDEIYKAIYTNDNWRIINSYKIKDKKDIEIICKALIDIHPIHGKDMSSYRTIEDLAYEWIQHNIVYDLLPDDSIWKDSVRSVDLDPEDQGRDIKEMYESRTGKKFTIEDIR